MHLIKFQKRRFEKTMVISESASTIESKPLLVLKHVIKKFPVGETEITILKEISLVQ